MIINPLERKSKNLYLLIYGMLYAPRLLTALLHLRHKIAVFYTVYS